jgi:hypothetical protein
MGVAAAADGDRTVGGRHALALPPEENGRVRGHAGLTDRRSSAVVVTRLTGPASTPAAFKSSYSTPIIYTLGRQRGSAAGSRGAAPSDRSPHVILRA